MSHDDRVYLAVLVVGGLLVCLGVAVGMILWDLHLYALVAVWAVAACVLAAPVGWYIPEWMERYRAVGR